MNNEAIDQALEALKTYDWGTDRGPLAPLEAAIVSTREDAAAADRSDRKTVGRTGHPRSHATPKMSCADC